MTMVAERKQNVPKLRFPEFDGEWEKHRLDQIADVARGKFSIRPRNDPRYFGGETPFVQTGDVVNAQRRLSSFSQSLNQLGVSVSKVFPEDTILMTIAANIGDVAITDFPVACPDSVVGIVCKEGTDPEFLFEVLGLKKQDLASVSTQNAQANINLQILNPLGVVVPELPEQQKIGAFLGAVDEKIAQLKKKEALLEDYKNGCMQKLFSRELRFKDESGDDYPDWREKRLGDIVSFHKGKGISKNDIVLAGRTRCIRYGELYTRYNEKITDVRSSTNLPETDLFFSRGGDVIIPASGEDRLDMARACCVVKAGIALGGDINILRGADNGVFLA